MITSIGQAMSGTITNKITDVASIILITTQDSSVVNLVSGSLPQAGGLESLALVNYPLSGTLPNLVSGQFLGLAVQAVGEQLKSSFISGSLPNADTMPLVQALSINK